MLTQSAANDLFNIPKVKKSYESYGFPRPGEKLTIPIISQDGTGDLLVDISRARIRLTKRTCQERYHQMIILVRLDLDVPPHTNPEVASVPLPCLTPHNGLTIDWLFGNSRETDLHDESSK